MREGTRSSGFVWSVLRWRVFVYQENSITAMRLPSVASFGKLDGWLVIRMGWLVERLNCNEAKLS